MGQQKSEAHKAAISASMRKLVRKRRGKWGFGNPATAAKIPRDAQKAAQAAGRVQSQKAADYYAPLLDLMRELRASGLSFEAVAAELNRRGIRTRPRPSKPSGAEFSGPIVYQILSRS